MLVLGEVRTGLLQSSVAVPPSVLTRVLDLLPGEPVRTSERPIAYAVSPDLTAGVDCRLPTRSGARAAGVGTVVSRVSVTGGRVVQSSAHARLARNAAGRRLAWSHYLGRPGTVETTGRADWTDLAAGHLDPGGAAGPQLGAIGERHLDEVQMSPDLDRGQPFRSRRTRFRWAAWVGPAAEPGRPELPGTELVVRDEAIRTLRLVAPGAEVADVVALCEDVALHDWLLTTLLRLVDRGIADAARAGSSGPRERAAVVTRLRPAVDHLLHLWMPGVRVSPALQEVWAGLERRPGFSRQWTSTVDRVRDQVAVSTVSLLVALAEGEK